MRLRRLTILKDQLPNDLWERVNAANQKYADIRDEWRAHFDKKVQWEVDSRLNTIGQYFKDAETSIDQSSTYKPEQLRRTIVEDLRPVLVEHNLMTDELEGKFRFVDGRLSGLAVDKAGFLWDAALEPAYPEKDYWWLYRKPRSRRR